MENEPPLDTVVELFAGRYQVRRKLPWNGLSLVYEADREGMPVAVAVLPVDCERAPRRAQRFEESATSLESLRHPHLVPATAHGVQHGVPFVEMALAEGRLLADALAEGPLERSRAFDIAAQVLDAVEHAHTEGVLHGDLTPANVLLHARDGGDQVQVVGFGLAPFVRMARDTEKTGPTGKGSGADARRYLAPEVLAGDPPTPATDIYGVGALLCGMLTGVPPASDPSRAPADARPFLARSMARLPSERYPDAASMRAALEAARAGELEGTPVEASAAGFEDVSIPLASSRPPPARARVGHGRRWMVIGGIAVATALAFGAGIWLRSAQKTEAPPRVAARSAPGTSAVRTTAHVEGGREEGAEGGGTPTASPPAGDQAAGPESDVRAGGAEGTPARNLLAGELPEPLRGPARRALAGEALTQAELMPVLAWGREHQDDPRPHLIVARVFLNRGWNTNAAERYLLAAGVSPEAREHAPMLEHLLSLAGNPQSGPAAAEAIDRIYGSAALPALRERLETDLRWDEKNRLQQLELRLQR